MTAREKAPDPSFGESLFQHMWDLWVQPEIERRGSPATQESLTRVVLEMAPDGPVVVKVEDEAGIEASVVANRALAEGEEVFVEDITNVKSIRPADIDPNNGWICFARMATGHAMLAFDFTYNKQRAAALLERAGQFLAAAEQAGQAALAVCIDNAFSAAELCVQAEMLVMQQKTNDHKVRGKWLAGWTDLGNAPAEHSHALWELAALRKEARYGSEILTVSEDRLSRLLRIVGEMLEHARVRSKASAHDA